MAKRFTSFSQFQNYIRQVENQNRQAINRFNQEVRRHNEKVKQAVNEFNREVDRHNQSVRREHENRKRAINQYNNAVRNHNAQVRANRQRIELELRRLANKRISTSYSTLQRSTNTLQDAYTRLESRFSDDSEASNEILALPGNESANSLHALNALAGQADSDEEDESELQESEIENELAQISEDLDKRWRGALFALNRKNPDAARHFCTSAREIFIEILDLNAPDADVVTSNPSCQKTDQGHPTRRAKIEFILQKKKIKNEELANFVDEDVKNILELFSVFNSGTHGAAGTFELPKLFSIKKRAEGGIMFLSKLIH